MSRESIGVINKAGNHTFIIPASHTASVTARFAQLPTNFIDPIVQYLVRYPYGCTEQVLSSLTALTQASRLQKDGVFVSSLLS